MSETPLKIQERMLTEIDECFDKSKGSFFYDLTMSAALELAKIYIMAEEILKKGFAADSKGTDLDRVCYEHGVSRKGATRAQGMVKVTGTAGASIPKGELVASENTGFAFTADSIIPQNGEATVQVQCIETGTIGNVPTGAIRYFPKTLAGLHDVKNPAPIEGGYHAEDDSSLKERYYAKVQTPATSGNIWHYLGWAREVTGVGDARVIPLWNGAGTVKVVIIDAEKQGASIGLVTQTATYIEQNRPIGAAVTVVSATEKPLAITVELTLDTGYTAEHIKPKLEKHIKDYLQQAAFKEDYISIAKVGNLILSTDGVLDYSDLTINGTGANIAITSSEVAVLGGVTFV